LFNVQFRFSLSARRSTLHTAPSSTPSTAIMPSRQKKNPAANW